jgi:hypothetical protein
MLDLADRQLGELSLFAMRIGMYREQRIGDVFQQSGMRWAQLSSRLGEEFKRHGAFDVRYFLVGWHQRVRNCSPRKARRLSGRARRDSRVRIFWSSSITPL